MKSDKQPAQSLDDLPRSGLAISRERWLDLIAKEERLLELYRDDDAERLEETECVSLLVAENAELRKDKARLDWLEMHISTQETSDLFNLSYSQSHSIRAAIDTARKAKP